MPSLTRWFVRSAMLYFVVALLVGVLLSLQNLMALPPIATARAAARPPLRSGRGAGLRTARLARVKPMSR